MLSTIRGYLSRLEAATSRLEDLAISQASGPAPKFGEGAVDKGPSDVSGAAVPPPPPPPPLPAAMADIPRSVEAFDENIINGKLKAFVDLTKSFASPLVIEQVRTSF